MRKKLYALALAASMLASVAPMGASAAEYVAQLDTNGDGSVSMTDVLLVNRYLLGAGYVSDPSDLDADANGVITSGDAQRIMAHMTYTSYSVSFVAGS